ncbi:MAG: PAS domain S-box protein [Bacteroidota bacterium]
MVWIAIVNNLSFFVTLSLIYVFIINRYNRQSLSVQILGGFLFGAFTVLGMNIGFELEPGLFFDGRSIILSIAGMFGGPVTAAIAFIVAVLYRIYLGGTGLWMGIMVIFSSASLGTLFYYLKRYYTNISPYLFYIGLAFLVHIFMLAFTILLPSETRIEVLSVLTFSILILYPLATILICMIFHMQEKYFTTVKNLTESEKRLSQLFHENQMVFLIIDPQTQVILDANKAAAKFYGYSVDELKKKKISNINTLSISQIDTEIEKAVTLKKNAFVFQHKLRNGQVRDVEVFSGPINYQGKRMVYSIVTDITNRLKAEKALTESEMSYRGLFENIEDAIFIQNQQGMLLDANNGAVKMFGYDKKQLVGKDQLFLAADGMNDLEKISNHIRTAYRGETIQFEFWAKNSKGEIFPVQIRLFNGEYFGKKAVIAIGHNISHRKEAQKKLEESQSNLQTLINVSDDVILLLDRDGNILTYNTKFNKLSQNESLLNQNILEIAPGNILVKFRKYFSLVLQNRTMVSYEEKHKGRKWHITIHPIVNKNGYTDRIAIYGRDITEREKLIELEKNLEVAKDSARLKQQFLSNMSHEMRTPMNGIIGMTNLLSNTTLSTEQKDYLETITESSQTLLSLINDILDLSRFESGKMPLNFAPVSLSDIKQKVINLFSKTIEKKGIQFVVRFSEKLPPVIVSDEKKIMQVLINLLGNAIKFTDKGTITLTSELQKKQLNKCTIKFVVIDTGIGIKQEFLTQIFHEFSQQDASKTRRFEGSGLGLAISQKIAFHLGGNIKAESKPGKGSKFSFTLQTVISEEKPDYNKENKSKSITQLRMNILLVEDKVVNQKVASLILKKMGCQTEIAVNGLEGIEKVKNNQYDAILMDIQMPVMDGITAVKELRKLKTKLPPIIGLSAEAMEGDAQKYINEGMDDYITKPIVPEILHEKLLKFKNNIHRK